MNPGLSIQIVWSLAAQEAIVAESQFIDPAHIFLGLLKYAELEQKHLELIVRTPDHISGLLAERDQVRVRLRDYSIQIPDGSRPIRYSLRDRLGKKGYKFDDQGVIHRSDAARKIFSKAAETATAANASEWCALHLLEALFNSPSPEIVEVLTGAGISGPWTPAKTPKLDIYGKDLTIAGQIKTPDRQSNDSEIVNDPVCKVLIDLLSQDKKPAVLLIRKGKRSPREIVEKVARYIDLVGESASTLKQQKRIIEIDWSRKDISGNTLERNNQSASILRDLVREASDAGNIILFVNDFHEFIHNDAIPRKMIADIFTEKNVQFICSTDEKRYLTLIQQDSEWKRLFRPIWIHDLDMPFQL